MPGCYCAVLLAIVLSGLDTGFGAASFIHELFTPTDHVAASRRQLLGCAGPLPGHDLGI